jgi:hypothetical protein
MYKWQCHTNRSSISKEDEEQDIQKEDQQHHHHQLISRLPNRQQIFIYRQLYILFNILFLLHISTQIVTGIAHDSIFCSNDNNDKTGQVQKCEDPSHHILKLVKRDDKLARQIAQEHGMLVKGEPFLDSHYFLSEDNTGAGIKRRRKRSIESMKERPEVIDLIIDRPRRRVKRDYIEQPSIVGPIEEEAHSIREPRQTTFFERRPVPKLPFPDPLYQDQWYLIGRAVGGFDMNVREAWLMGYAGRNVSISILDDGIQRDHPDLIQNYDPYASTDINDHDADPTPQNNGDNKYSF